MTEKDFKKWEKTHKDSGHCEKNFDESSGMMEVRAAEIMCKRSIEKYKMRYKYIISDGDTKTFSNLEVVKPYGPNFVIEKLDCINHIGKRMGKGLLNAKNEPLLPEVIFSESDFNEQTEVTDVKKSTPSTKKGQSGKTKDPLRGTKPVKKRGPPAKKEPKKRGPPAKKEPTGKKSDHLDGKKNVKKNASSDKKTVSLGKDLNSQDKKPVTIYTTMKGKNGITDSDIDAHQRYYKINIRSHSTAQAMNKAIWGTFLHLTSTDAKPQHHWCELQNCWYLK